MNVTQNMNSAQITAPVRTAKHSKGSLILMGLLALAFAFIVTKEVSLPPILIVSAAFVGGIVLMITGMSRPQVITYVLVAYLPFSKILPGGFGGLATALNLTNILMGFVILVWLSGKYSKTEPFWLRTPLNLPILLFMFLGCVSVARGSYYDSGVFWPVFIEFKRWLTPIFLYFLVLNTVKDRGTIKNVVIIMMIVTALVGLMAAYDYFELGDVGDLERARIGGISDHSNTLAAFFNYYMFLPLAFLLLNMGRSVYWWLIVPFLIQFRGIMVTFSRGGYLAFAAALYAITFFRSRFLFVLLIFATWIVLLNPILLPPGIRYRFQQTFQKNVSYSSSVDQLEESLESSAHTRVEVWKGAVEMIKEYPVFGIGYGLFYSRIQNYWSEHRPIDAHNTYLIIAAEMGIPTLVVFLWIVLLAFWNTHSLYQTTLDPFAKAVALGFLAGLFGLLVSNMFGSRLDSQEVSSYFWILLALVMRLRILDEREGLVLARAPRKLDSISSNFKQKRVPVRRKLDACWIKPDTGMDP